ncbi:MAG: MFS transporter, partial [Deltaproteobacteria bacterium]
MITDPDNRRHLRALAILAVTQTVGWGVVGVLPVLASAIAEDLRLGLPTVFAGTSVMYVALALTARLAGRGCVRFGSMQMMAASSLVIGVGLGVLALAGGGT